MTVEANNKEQDLLTVEAEEYASRDPYSPGALRESGHTSARGVTGVDFGEWARAHPMFIHNLYMSDPDQV